MTISSPWQWFCSTRTLSNCLETTLTVVALTSWPWQWSMDLQNEDIVDEDGLRTRGEQEDNDEKSSNYESNDQVSEHTDELARSVTCRKTSEYIALTGITDCVAVCCLLP